MSNDTLMIYVGTTKHIPPQTGKRINCAGEQFTWTKNALFVLIVLCTTCVQERSFEGPENGPKQRRINNRLLSYRPSDQLSPNSRLRRRPKAVPRMSLKNRLSPRNSWRSLWHAPPAVLVAFLINFLREIRLDSLHSGRGSSSMSICTILRGNMTGLFMPATEVPTTDMDYESTDESADEYAT